ncbi:hypothetical protein CO251_07010 [Sulfobacillus sp. hq2]|nr:hypothetical protein CO251_07010 [Sulfobacillus sp. hq2]
MKRSRCRQRHEPNSISLQKPKEGGRVKSPEQPLTPARIAHILEGLAIDGQHYANNTYDQHRYARIQELARILGGISKDAPPLSTITPVTPKVGVDGAVFKQRELLLIRRRDSHQWALPGGAVEIGETPSEAVIREVVEETGIVMQADYVVGVFDNWMDRRETSHHLYHIVIRGHYVSGELLPQPEEIADVQWVQPEELPPQDQFHPGHYDRVVKVLDGAIGVMD